MAVPGLDPCAAIFVMQLVAIMLRRVVQDILDVNSCPDGSNGSGLFYGIN